MKNYIKNAIKKTQNLPITLHLIQAFLQLFCEII